MAYYSLANRMLLGQRRGPFRPESIGKWCLNFSALQ
jgi:hypothetical protein